MKTWQLIEIAHIRETTKASEVGMEIDVDAFPDIGASFRKDFITAMDGKVPPSFVRFFSELSHEDTTKTFADWGRSRQHYLIEAKDGGWTLIRKTSRFSEDYNAWVMKKTTSISFTTIPERFVVLLGTGK